MKFNPHNNYSSYIICRLQYSIVLLMVLYNTILQLIYLTMQYTMRILHSTQSRVGSGSMIVSHLLNTKFKDKMPLHNIPCNNNYIFIWIYWHITIGIIFYCILKYTRTRNFSSFYQRRVYLLRTPPSSDALRHSGGLSLLCTSATVTLYLLVLDSRDSLPGTVQKMSSGATLLSDM